MARVGSCSLLSRSGGHPGFSDDSLAGIQQFLPCAKLTTVYAKQVKDFHSIVPLFSFALKGFSLSSYYLDRSIIQSCSMSAMS